LTSQYDVIVVNDEVVEAEVKEKEEEEEEEKYCLLK
jgi:hypothetical protein